VAGYSPANGNSDGTVSVFNGVTNQLTATIWPVGPPPDGWQHAVDTSTNSIYVANRGSDSVSVLT
jgi:DNA-binding beta-propeller fold protein YncE